LIFDLRPSTEDDYPRLTAVWKAAVEATHDFVTPEEIAGWEPRIASEFLPAAEVTVAVDGSGEPIGFIGSDGDSLEMLFVDPGFHGRGVGRALVEYLMKDHDSLNVEVNEDNPGAVAFYEKLGFRAFDWTELDSEGNQHPLVHMRFSRGSD